MDSMSQLEQISFTGPDLRTPNGGLAGLPRLPHEANWTSGFGGGGRMGALIRAFDWSRSPLGPIESWPSSLIEMVRICLRSRFQLAIYWGPHLVLLYNDAEREVLGAMHPRVLGMPAAEILTDMWDVVGPMLRGVLDGGVATWSVDQALRLNRYGFVEEAFFTYSYSPIADGDRVGGVLLVSFETTDRVFAERRLRTLRELAAETAKAQNAGEACTRAALVLAGNKSDLPFCLLYLTDREGEPRLCASTGIAVAPDPDLWPLRPVALGQQAECVEDLPSLFAGGEAPPSRTALVLPIAQAGLGATGWLVAGVSDLQALNEAYRGFFELVAAQISTAIAAARALEEERGRAHAHQAQEQALRRAHDELEERVRARTRELSLANTNLVQQVARRRQVEEGRTDLRRRLVHAQEEEHRRIARELHDDLTQRLAVLAIDAGMLEQLPGCPVGVEERARGMREQLIALSDGVHSLSRQLHPSIVDELGVVDALRAECQSLGQRDAIAVRFVVHDVPNALDREVALCVYRVTQEALRNVARHAKTRKASVRLFATDRHLMLRVRDRGVGFDVVSRGKLGLGLESMRERARLIRARLVVESRRGQGTNVSLRVPLPGSRT
jgi:signal transduction histidine kinase